MCNVVTFDLVSETIDIEDLGVTMRTLLAVANTAAKEKPKRVWKIRYKDAILGSVRIKLTK